MMSEREELTDSMYRSLYWGLDRLCLWGELDSAENADPHLRAETAASVKQTFRHIAYECKQEVRATDE